MQIKNYWNNNNEKHIKNLIVTPMITLIIRLFLKINQNTLIFLRVIFSKLSRIFK